MIKDRFSLRRIVLGFIFLSIIFIGIPYFLSQKTVPKEKEQEENLTPSEVLNNRAKYASKEIVIRGKISLAPVVCQKSACPSDDSCCGCPDERDLLIADPGVVLVARSKQRLKLLNDDYESFCRRRPFSCEYDCQDWFEGAIYDIQGVFFSETPPVGLKLSLDQYFVVDNKALVRRAGFQKMLENVFSEIKGILGPLARPDSYVLD